MCNQWKSIPSTGNAYFACPCGELRGPTGKTLRQRLRGGSGYRCINTSVRGHHAHRTRTVHSLVAEAHLGPRPPGLEVNHKDGDRINNRLENLEYVTKSEQHRHRVHVLGSDKICKPGEANPMAKITESDVARIFSRRRSGALHREIADEMLLSNQQVSRILSGQRWAHFSGG